MGEVRQRRRAGLRRTQGTSGKDRHYKAGNGVSSALFAAEIRPSADAETPAKAQKQIAGGIDCGVPYRIKRLGGETAPSPGPREDPGPAMV
jgi:hypothetical protein